MATELEVVGRTRVSLGACTVVTLGAVLVATGPWGVVVIVLSVTVAVAGYCVTRIVLVMVVVTPFETCTIPFIPLEMIDMISVACEVVAGVVTVRRGNRLSVLSSTPAVGSVVAVSGATVVVTKTASGFVPCIGESPLAFTMLYGKVVDDGHPQAEYSVTQTVIA